MKNTNSDLAERKIQRTAAEIRAAYARKCTDTDSPLFRWLWGLVLSKGLTDGEKVTGLALALHFNKGEGIAWPSIPTLAAICRRKDRRPTQRHVHALHREGFIDYKPGSGAGNSSRYTMRSVPQATLDELAGALEKGDSHDTLSAEKRVTGEAQKGDFPCSERVTFHAQKGDSHDTRTVQGTLKGNSPKNTHTAEPKSNGRTKPEPSRSGVCVEDSFSWKEDGQKEGQTPTQARPSDAGKVIDFAAKRSDGASQPPAQPSGRDAGSADEKFHTFWQEMPRNSRASFRPTLRAWCELSADEQEFALDAMPHYRRHLTKEAEAAGRKLDGHMHFIKQTPAQWLADRDFYSYSKEVEKVRAERVTGFPDHVRRSEVRRVLVRWYEDHLDPEFPHEPRWERTYDGGSYRSDVDLGGPPGSEDFRLPADLDAEARADAEEKVAEAIQKREYEREQRRQIALKEQQTEWLRNLYGTLDTKFNRRDMLKAIAEAADGDGLSWSIHWERSCGPGPGEEGTVINDGLIEMARAEQNADAPSVAGMA